MRILFIFGTRPEAIKMAPVILEARRRAGVTPLILSTGQHREMLRPLLALFEITPDVDLDVMRPGQTLSGIAARVLENLDAELQTLTPDWVVVQGDTTTAMTAALAAFHRRIPVAHVEAGLRTDDLTAPFPEEANRRIISQIASCHFPPTESARANLLRDGAAHTGARIILTGNTVIDALFFAREAVGKNPPEHADLAAIKAWKRTAPERQAILVTGHRRENFGAPFREFCHALRDIAEAHPQALLVYPVHLNPNVQAPVHEILGSVPNVRLAPAADYLPFVAMMDAVDFLITDSGGVQEEAPALGKPVLVTRDVTERPEAVDAGGVMLTGPNREKLRTAAGELLQRGPLWNRMAQVRLPYGDGHAAARILDALLASS